MGDTDAMPARILTSPVSCASPNPEDPFLHKPYILILQHLLLNIRNYPLGVGDRNEANW